MEEYILYNDLYDCYSKLLTEKQRLYFEDYYFKNLSLSEISGNYNISRNAIYKQIKIAVEKLKEYEGKLKLYEKKKIIEEIIKTTNDKKMIEKLEKILWY